MNRVITLGFVALLSLSFSQITLAKGSTLVDGSGKPVKAGVGGCAKVAKSTKNDFH